MSDPRKEGHAVLPPSYLSERTWTRVWIPVGCILFLVALAVSALVVPQLGPLHLLQALIYVAVMMLTRRNSAFGFGAGVTIAVAWNSLNLLVTHLVQAGAIAFWSLLRTGQLRKVDTMMVPVGTIGHFILIVACLAAFFDRRTNSSKKWWKFAAGGLIVLAYMALIILIARPR